MSHPDDQKPDPAILRSMAEAQLARHPVTEPLPADALLHELQVHQVELEMQNEALRLAQTALEASRDRYVDLYDFAPVGYLTINSNGIIETLNLTATTLLGVARKDLLRRLFTTLVVAADQPCWMALFLFALKQDGKHNVEVTLQRGDGTVFPALLDCAAQKVGTGGTELRIALTDISERRRLEAELARAFVDQTLDGEIHLGPAGRAVGVGRHGVGEDRAGTKASCGNVVGAGDEARALAEGRQRNRARAHVGDIVGAHR